MTRKRGSNNNTKKVAVFVFAILFLFAFNTTRVDAATPFKVSISKGTQVSDIIKGKSITIKGTIKANKKIKRVEAGIVKASSSKWIKKYKYDNKKVNSKTFNLNKAKKKVLISKLPEGAYYYRVYAHSYDGKVAVLVNKRFEVYANNKPQITIKDKVEIPNLTKGQNVSVKGTIGSNQNMSRVEVGVVNASTNKWVDGLKYDNKKVNSKSFNLSKAAGTVKLNNLNKGTYYFRVYVHTPNKVTVLINQKFTVRNPASSSSNSGTTTNGDAGQDPTTGEADNTEGGEQITCSPVTFENRNSVPTLKIGQAFNIKGTIKSAAGIDRIEIGVVSKFNNKWVPDAKYDSSEIEGNEFDVSTASGSIYFSRLSPGKYNYRIYVHTPERLVILLDEPFTVSAPATNAEAIDAACNWAVMIAADNSFTYGTGERSHRYGCYFCGTSLSKKGSTLVNGHSYEKTYCCNPFVHAAFAHGAGDQNMLDACRKGGGVYMKAESFTRYGNWKSMGKIKYSELKRGDVLVKSSHMSLYLGNNKIAHAGGEGWGAGSISTKSIDESYYNTYSFVMRYTGKGGSAE